MLLDIDSLVLDGSPRLLGEDVDHTQILAETDARLPAILVHRSTMRVIDGMHRVRAAIMRGDEKISATFFDGDASEAFVRAVEANIAYGLPLSLSDRHAAAKRILDLYPQWSDRSIAAVAGLSARTIRGIRASATEEIPQLHSRVGRDGKTRPLNFADGRRRAAELIARRPEASLREIARNAGISVGTARDVRKRIDEGRDPIPEGVRKGKREPAHSTISLNRPRPRNGVDPAVLLDNLRKDPSVRYSESGRHMVRWLGSRIVQSGSWQEIADSVPSHCIPAVAQIATECATAWLSLAEELQSRAERLGTLA
ncbi:ParB/RepB/Spo0J family partition protein [Allonocardiopsis opalescens]|uniref:ParB-like nuclease family protein n=1 Tax=Allonocardiopsis opalescens TaxID=1144618 RepID=A0A2T0PYE6_9ACTN|nr:ParB N-terminal domain-containing protein [Allonocardiopsis opalescens]PRX96532.1 ParB-like nuclease family protein [Allonocardiopsis opalescens]